MSDFRDAFSAIVKNPSALQRTEAVAFALEGTLLNPQGKLNRRMVPVFLHVAAQQSGPIYILTEDKERWNGLIEAMRRHKALNSLPYQKDEFYDVMAIAEQPALVFDANPNPAYLKTKHVHINPEDSAVKEFLSKRGYKQDAPQMSVVAPLADAPFTPDDPADEVRSFAPRFTRPGFSEKVMQAAKQFGAPKSRPA